MGRGKRECILGEISDKKKFYCSLPVSLNDTETVILPDIRQERDPQQGPEHTSPFLCDTVFKKKPLL